MDANLTLKHRIDTAFFQIVEMDPIQRRDLQKMWRAARDQWNKLDFELIQCRRQNKLTLKYTELAEEFLEHIHNFEQWLLMATLMY